MLLLTQLIVWPMETSWSRAWLMDQVKYFYMYQLQEPPITKKSHSRPKQFCSGILLFAACLKNAAIILPLQLSIYNLDTQTFDCLFDFVRHLFLIYLGREYLLRIDKSV